MIGKTYVHKTSKSFTVKVLAIAEGGVLFKGQYFDAISVENFEKNYEPVPQRIALGRYGYNDSIIRIVAVVDGWAMCFCEGDTSAWTIEVSEAHMKCIRIGDL